MAQQDIKLLTQQYGNKDGIIYSDFDFAQGDFILYDSDDQTIQDIVQSFTAWFKTDFINGVGIFQYLNSNVNEQLLYYNIRQFLERDGFKINNISVLNSSININATRL